MDHCIEEKASLCRAEIQDLLLQRSIIAARSGMWKQQVMMQNKEPCNAERLMTAYLSLPTECRDYQFAQRGRFSTPASSSAPDKKSKNTLIHGIIFEHNCIK